MQQEAKNNIFVRLLFIYRVCIKPLTTICMLRSVKYSIKKNIASAVCFLLFFCCCCFYLFFFGGGGGVKCVPIVLCIISEYICVFLKGFRDISVMCIQNITI